MPLDFLTVGATPVPGYECVEDMGGSVFYRLWKVKSPDGTVRMWKAIDLVVGNANLETRNLEMLVRVQHPRLNTLVHYHTLPDLKALIIESELPKRSLRERLNECKAAGQPGLPAQELLGYLRQAAEGIDHLNAPRHQFQGQQVAIYHRDLRPESLLLFDDGGQLSCKVSDFGLAKPVTDQVAQHSQGLLHFDYDPPEFYEGVTAPTSDQYSLAINYFELRTGKLPFQGTMLEQLQARLNEQPDLAGLTNAAERDAVKKALSKDPKRRYGSCKEFVDKVAAALSGGAEEESASVRPATASAPAGKPASGRGVPVRPGSTGSANYAPAAAAVAAPPASAGSLPGVTIRKPPPGTVPTYDELAAASGEDISAIVAGAPPIPKSWLRQPVSRGATPSDHSDPLVRMVAKKPAPKADPEKIPMVWVMIISGMVFVAVALIAKMLVVGE